MTCVRPSILILAAALLALPARAAPPAPPSTDTALSMATTVAARIMTCWKPVPGLKKTDIVVLDIHLNRDGTLAGPPQLNLAKTGTPLPPPGAIGEAKHAVERCAPYKLPPDRYGKWKVQRVTFNPSSLFP